MSNGERNTPKWKEHFNVHKLSLFERIDITVLWSMTPGRKYDVLVFGRKLDKDYAELDEAKLAGLKAAQDILSLIETRIANAIKDLKSDQA